MAKRIKVLQLQSKYAAGVNHVADMIASALPEERYEVTMAYLEGEPEVVHSNGHCFRFSKRQCRGLRREIKAALMVYCREQEFDIVIGHRFKAISALMPVVRELNTVKAIAVVHGVGDYDRWYRKLLAGYYFARHWQVVAVSSHVKNYLATASKIFNECLVSVIPNAVDVELLRSSFLPRAQARNELLLSDGDFVFGAHGRLANVKGYDYLLEAFAPLAREHSNVKLLLIGGGPLFRQLQKQAKDLGVDQQVTFTGYREGASRYLSALDVFVMPSHSEGLSIALLEAMSAKLPVLASNISSITAVVAQKDSLLPVADVNAWTEALKAYFELPRTILKLNGSASFEKAQTEFNKPDFQANYRRKLTL